MLASRKFFNLFCVPLFYVTSCPILELSIHWWHVCNWIWSVTSQSELLTHAWPRTERFHLHLLWRKAMRGHRPLTFDRKRITILFSLDFNWNWILLSVTSVDSAHPLTQYLCILSMVYGHVIRWRMDYKLRHVFEQIYFYLKNRDSQYDL